MTVTDSSEPVGAPADLEFDRTPGWADSWRIRALRGGATVLSCRAVQPELGLWYLEDFLPCRDDPSIGPALVAAGRWLAATHAPSHVMAVHPAGWDAPVAAAGGRLLHRVVHMGTVLDADQLRRHTQPLPDGYLPGPLTPATPPDDLVALSPPADQRNDRKTWRNLLTGALGPLIGPASLTLTRDERIRAAIAVTEYQGAPLVGHIVIADSERGRGLGRSLLVESLRRLHAAGYHECRLNVVEDNQVAHRLYRTLGFTAWRTPLRVSLLTTIEDDD